MDYKKLLEHSYEMETSHGNPACIESRLQYLSDFIFDFTTYSNTHACFMAKKAVEVIEAITIGATFEYIQKSEDSHLWYLVMVNTKFFDCDNLLEWGGSIRGAWWAYDETFKYPHSGLWVDGEQWCDPEGMNTDQWKEFMTAIVEFARPEMESVEG